MAVRADRAWRVGVNGIKRVTGEGDAGLFGVVNLLGPRRPTQTNFWRETFTYVQLRYEFVNARAGTPVTIGRTYLTFYDFDSGNSDTSVSAPGGGALS